MPSRFSAQSGKGALFVALALVATLLVPSVYTWAVKSGAAKPGIEPFGQVDRRDIDPDALAYFQRLAAPNQERALSLSPLDDYTPTLPRIDKRKGLVFTQVGFFNPKDARSFEGLPAELRPVASHPAPQGKGLGLGSGIGIIQISEAALKEKGYDAIEAQIRAMGAKVMESVPDRALVVRGSQKAMQDLVGASFVEASLPYAPAFKLDPVMGRQMLVNKARASKVELDVHVVPWSKDDVDALLKDMRTGRGGDTVQLLEDGLTILATLDKNEIRRLAKNDLVRGISEVGEYQLSSFIYIETPPVVQVGETEHTGAATPYWDAGVNGGGCGNPANPPIGNTNTANCGTAVPGVVVAVLDNGASTDAAALAHSTANLTAGQINTLITTNSHRKIRSYAIGGTEAVTPIGATCDSVLFGAQTHGNVAAGMIAGNASALGYQFQKNTNAGSFGDVRRINLDGTARGARLAIQDFGGSADCNKAELVERGNFITPISLTSRMDDAYLVGARLHVMPFGSPNWGANGTTSAGFYGTASDDPYKLDLYLANNLEYQVFVPVGNKGFNLVNGRDIIPDYFDGDSSALSDGSSIGQLLQISPPATAKNIVASGATCTDTMTMFGAFNEEENVQNYTSKGPATSASLRAAPIVTAVGNDRAPTGGGPTPMGMYTVKSKDNNQDGTIDTEIDEQARGTSFGAANLAASAALIQDYFHQGFYPTGDRVQGDRIPNMSGAAIKAMLAASANVSEQLIGANASSIGMNGNDIQVATTRGSAVLVSGVEKILVNNQQGYGRAIVSQILPIANWPNVGIPPDAATTGDTIEYPAMGLLVWDGIDPDGAGPMIAEPPINNAGNTQKEHTFRALGTAGQIRICLAWPDPPGELLVNDLDLEVISPSAKTYDGNVYNPSSQVTGQWSLNRLADKSDQINPIECVHLTSDPDANPATNDNQIEPGVYTIRVKRGVGGAVPGQISGNTGVNEDANNNNRLDAGEDTDGDGLLDKGGQVYALVASGPIVAEKGAGNPNFGNFPLAMTRMDKIRYSCADAAHVQVWDTDAAAAAVSAGTTVRVYNAAGAVVDTESNLTFTGANGVFNSGPLSVRLGASGTAGNGILEGDTGYTVETTYVDATANSRTTFGRAPIDCEPNFIGGVFGNAGERNTQDVLFGGCDTDQSFDSNETVTYSVAVVNNSLYDEFTDVSATLSVCAVPFNPDGTCANGTTPLTVLDSPKNIGRLPVGQPEAVTFSIRVGAVAAVGKVYLRLSLSETGAEKVLSRVAYTFTHALGSDRGSIHFSTDYPDGSAVIERDLNRPPSFVIEPNDRPGLTLGSLDETVQFSSLFVTDPATGRINNRRQGSDEAYPALGIFNTGADTNTNGVLDRHVLDGATPSPGLDSIPWNFDANNGGWYVAQDAATILGSSTGTLPAWHYVTNGTCGFQTQSKSNCVIPSGGVTGGTPGFDNDGPGPNPCVALTAGAFTGGVWHTGSGVAGSCSITTTTPCYLNSDCPGGETCNGGADNPNCGNYGIAFNVSTPARAEYRYDILISPVIEKVNQGLDSNGFEYTVEYQRLAFNATNQVKYDGVLYVNVDNDVDTNNNNALIKPGVARGDGLQYYDFAFAGPFDPVTSATQFDQYTFGPTTDPDGSLTHCTITTATACTQDAQCPGGEQCGKLTGDETGFPGFDRASTNTNATKPIIPNPNSILRPYPGPGEVFVGQDTVAGPSRNVEADFVDYEDNALQFFTPGKAGNRWQIGLGFLVFESPTSGGDGDFGWSIDDVVFEWDEVHPVAETTAACDRIGIGGPSEIAAGCRCATLSVDRTNLYDCNETVKVTVTDPRYATGALAPCLAGTGAADTIAIRVWSNSEPFPGETVMLTETGPTTGVFTGQIGVSGIYNTQGAVYTTPGTETNLFFAYEDNQCDSNHNHLAGQSDFLNLDGDTVQAAAGRDGICGTDDDNTGLFGADGVCGYNPATGAIDDTGDNCATVYNWPADNTVDDDGDHVGGTVVGGVFYGCDNCPNVYNPGQFDGDLDGVGDACDYDDIDHDGIIDAIDNCPDVYNPDQNQTGGSAPRGTACAGNGDTDADTIIDKNDNCVMTPNTNQLDSDAAAAGFVIPLGNACDGDCQGTCAGGANAGKACRWDSTNPYGFATQCPSSTCSNVVCSTENDDADVDAVMDSDDNCAVTYNQTVLPGSDPPVQTDDNFNGIGNACDPVGSYDENLDGIPDDTASGAFFALAATCKNVPLANLVVLSTIVRDRGELGTCTGGPTTQACSTGSRVGYACTSGADCPGGACVSTPNACGDGDAFADPGERVRITLALQNITGFELTGVTLSATTADPDVACVLDSTIAIASFPNGATVDTKTLSPGDDPGQPGDGRFFEAVISPAASTTNPGQPSRANFTLALNSNEVGGTQSVVPISLLLDLDIPPGVVVTYTDAKCDGEIDPAHAGQACNVTNVCTPTSACRPGLIWEDFENIGTGNPACVGVPATGGQPQPNCFANTIGFIEKNAASDSNTTVVGKACFGFVEVLGCGPNTAACGGCQIDPDFQTDWHFEQAGTAPLAKAFRGARSAHWGRHTQTATRAGDTTPHREIEAFVTNPINLTIIPGAGDLFLSFWHIVSFADDNRINFQVGQAGDRADVEIAVDLDPTAADNFSRWTKLAPFQNVWEHTTQVFSWFGYCEFTPTDGAKLANPAVFGETMCFPDGLWSHSGNVIGTNIQAIFNAQGPGQLGSQGEGVWVQSQFSLLDYIGQRVKIRWIGTSWAFGIGWNSYMEPPAGGNPFDIATSDDGWWVDSIRITGAITAPAAPILEPTTIPLTSQCPASAAANCDETQGTNGFNIAFAVRDSDGDGVVVNGENIILDASQTLNPGGCADGVPQYRFTKDPGDVLLQDWSTAASLKLGNTTDGDLYKVQIRCSSDLSCTTAQFSPPTGAVPGGCPVWAGPVPAPFEPTVAFSLTPASSAMNMSMSNMLNILFAPGHGMPPPTYGHSFVRTDALAVGTGSAGNDGGISGVIASPNATINQAFKNVVGGAQTPTVPPAAPGLGSCDINADVKVCASPVAPATITWTDASVPAVGTLYYYLGDTFTSAGGPAKNFGAYGPTRIGSTPGLPAGNVGVRTATISCP